MVVRDRSVSEVIEWYGFKRRRLSVVSSNNETTEIKLNDTHERMIIAALLVIFFLFITEALKINLMLGSYLSGFLTAVMLALIGLKWILDHHEEIDN